METTTPFDPASEGLAKNRPDTSQQRGATRAQLRQRTVVKKNAVTVTGVVTVDVIDGGEDQPSIVVHRLGDEVQSVEFVCVCGRCADVTLSLASDQPTREQY